MICVHTHGEHLTDKQIIAEVTGDQNADDDTNQEEDEEDVEVTDEAIERPSAAAVNEALQILERLSLFSNDAAAMTKSIHDLMKAVSKEIMNNKKQSTINDYFRK